MSIKKVTLASAILFSLTACSGGGGSGGSSPASQTAVNPPAASGTNTVHTSPVTQPQTATAASQNDTEQARLAEERKKAEEAEKQARLAEERKKAEEAEKQARLEEERKKAKEAEKQARLAEERKKAEEAEKQARLAEERKKAEEAEKQARLAEERKKAEETEKQARLVEERKKAEVAEREKQEKEAKIARLIASIPANYGVDKAELEKLANEHVTSSEEQFKELTKQSKVEKLVIFAKDEYGIERKEIINLADKYHFESLDQFEETLLLQYKGRNWRKQGVIDQHGFNQKYSQVLVLDEVRTTGIETAVDRMPVMGNATYAGVAFDSNESSGPLTYSANFGAKIGSGVVEGLDGHAVLLDEGKISGNRISSTARIATRGLDDRTGSYDLGFYGPNAEEIGGELKIKQWTKDEIKSYGLAGSRKEIE